MRTKEKRQKVEILEKMNGKIARAKVNECTTSNNEDQNEFADKKEKWENVKCRFQ